METNKTKDFIMSPKVDFAFKEIMRNEIVRKGFLSAVLGIKDTEIKETVLLLQAMIRLRNLQQTIEQPASHL